MNKEEYVDFCRERIRGLLESSGKNQKTSSELIGKAPDYFNKIVNGRTLPSLPMLFEICEHFGITPRDFFSCDDESASGLIQEQELLAHFNKLPADEKEAIRTIIMRRGKVPI